jgi:cytoskeletal protein RodZ
MKPEPNAFDPYHLWLQIPKEFRPPTHYQLLGLSVGESNEEVIRQATLMRSAYVRHFQNGPNAADATRILEELADASRVLIDPSLRAEYEAKIKPVAKPTPKPVLSNAGPVTIPKPKAPTADYDLVDDRRPKAKKKKSKRRDSLFGTVLGLVFAVAGIAGIAYLANVAFREPDAALTSTEIKKPDTESVPSNKDADLSAKPSLPTNQPKPRPADAVVVRLSVEPASAELTLEPIGASNASSGPKASIEGDGSERTIVAEKGALPIVVAGTAAGHQPTRVTVFSSDAGRLVVVQLQKEGARGGSSSSASKGKRRPVGSYQIGIPISTKDNKPVWKYAVSRPAPDWATNTFGDAIWNEAEGAFGTKAGKNAVKMQGLWLRTNWASRDIWLRKRVVLPPAVTTAMIRWTYRNDNAVSVVVNGVHVFTDQTTNLRPTSRVTEAVGFQGGENIVGVHCSNSGGSGLIDLGFEWIAMEEVK